MYSREILYKWQPAYRIPHCFILFGRIEKWGKPRVKVKASFSGTVFIEHTLYIPFLHAKHKPETHT
jgi:hypothetical protein